MSASAPMVGQIEKSKPSRITMITSVLLCSFFLTGGSSALGWHIDPDDSGIFRHYNSDNSMEASIAYDMGDDEVWKMFYIDQDELDLAEKAQLWVYAKCFGTKDETTGRHTHKIINRWGNGGTDLIIIQEFYCYEQFDYDNYHWQMFEFPAEYLHGDGWNQIEIRDDDWYTYNNIRIGIDQTFGGTPEDPSYGLISDFDTSFWYSGGAHVTPDDPTEIEGELMIKLELIDVQHNNKWFPAMEWDEYWYDYYPYGGRYIPIDFDDDDVYWEVTLDNADLNNYGYARFYIYGYSWIVEEIANNDYMILDVNGDQYASTLRTCGLRLDPSDTGIGSLSTNRPLKSVSTHFKFGRSSLAAIATRDTILRLSASPRWTTIIAPGITMMEAHMGGTQNWTLRIARGSWECSS